jgi:hypothetical protein
MSLAGQELPPWSTAVDPAVRWRSTLVLSTHPGSAVLFNARSLAPHLAAFVLAEYQTLKEYEACELHM